jgi:hypothetical protein
MSCGISKFGLVLKQHAAADGDKSACSEWAKLCPGEDMQDPAGCWSYRQEMSAVLGDRIKCYIACEGEGGEGCEGAVATALKRAVVAVLEEQEDSGDTSSTTEEGEVDLLYCSVSSSCEAGAGAGAAASCCSCSGSHIDSPPPPPHCETPFDFLTARSFVGRGTSSRGGLIGSADGMLTAQAQVLRIKCDLSNLMHVLKECE